MIGKPVTVDEPAEQMAFLVLPLSTFTYLTDEATKRNLSLAELVGKAVEGYLRQNTGKE